MTVNNGPVIVRPQFQVARPVTLTTVPPGLQVLADRAPVPTPDTLDWGWNSTHSVGPVSPQQSPVDGSWWVFSSWSDGGAATHAYQVGPTTQAVTLTATYVPGAAIAFNTVPANLQLQIDGRGNWPSYGFVWGVGETHQFSAPAQQTDAQGRIWAFSSWSNGGAAAQSLTVPASAAGVGIRLVATYTPVGHLIVSSSLAGLSVMVNGASCATPCDTQGPVDRTVALSAPASVPQGNGTRSDFLGWPGSGSAGTDWSVTLTADPINISANYHTMNRLAAAAAPPQGASWALQPGSPDGYYDSQATVSVAVTALPGYRFHSWSGDLSGTKPLGVLAMNQPHSVLAQLDPVPYIAPTGVANAAGTTTAQPGVAAGSVVAIFGASLASAAAVAPNGPLPQTLGGITVQSGGRLLPLFFVSPTQINVQMPDDMPLGNQTLTVSSLGQPDVQAGFNVVKRRPRTVPTGSPAVLERPVVEQPDVGKQPISGKQPIPGKQPGIRERTGIGGHSDIVRRQPVLRRGHPRGRYPGHHQFARDPGRVAHGLRHRVRPGLARAPRRLSDSRDTGVPHCGFGDGCGRQPGRSPPRTPSRCRATWEWTPCSSASAIARSAEPTRHCT